MKKKALERKLKDSPKSCGPLRLSFSLVFVKSQYFFPHRQTKKLIKKIRTDSDPFFFIYFIYHYQQAVNDLHSLNKSFFSILQIQILPDPAPYARLNMYLVSVFY